MTRTTTKAQILSHIARSGPIRPVEITKRMGLSAPAIHRHLKALVDGGLIERRGSPPYTAYVIAGVPDFDAIFAWAAAKTVAINPNEVSERRDAFAARLPHLMRFTNQGVSAKQLPLILAAVGEVGNNSFDHNLGLWRDVPGCWFEGFVTGGALWVVIADRGQGVLHSLSHALPNLKDHQSALEVAFTLVVSGRAPESRGNGLKFVRQTITDHAKCGVACASGDGLVSYGEREQDCATLLRKHFRRVQGTVTVLTWKLS